MVLPAEKVPRNSLTAPLGVAHLDLLTLKKI